MANGSRARSKEEADMRASFSEAPTRLGLPFSDAEGASRSGLRDAVGPAEVVSLDRARGGSEPTALLSGAHGGLGSVPAASAAPAGRRRRRDRRTGDRNLRPHSPEDRVGQVLSATYRIERLIAVGGMGAVYEVAHMRLSQRFAVKFLDRGLSHDAEAYARFRQEAEIAAQVNHDNVVQVFDFNTDEAGSPYMVMELVAGETLDRLISRQARSDGTRSSPSSSRFAMRSRHAIKAASFTAISSPATSWSSSMVTGVSTSSCSTSGSARSSRMAAVT